MDNWFPYPNELSDIYLLQNFPCNIYEFDLFKFFTLEERKELKDKVSVTTSKDGSAKDSARILEVSNYIIKTDLTLMETDFHLLEKKLNKRVLLSKKLEIYHPEKQWFIIKYNNEFLPVTICPKLKTLHTLDNVDTKLESFLEIIKIGVEKIKIHDIELDLNPSNFAFQGDNIAKLYYLDDELYEKATLESIGSFIIHRIRSEIEINEEKWLSFSNDLIKVLKEYLSGYSELELVIKGIEEFPLPEKFKAKKDIVFNSLKNNDTYKSFISKEEINKEDTKLPDSKNEKNIYKVLKSNKNITCILADIHSNLPALEKVISEAKSIGANRFIVLGDIVGYGPYPNEVIEIIRNLPNSIVLQGNHDYAIGNKDVDTGMSRIGHMSALWTIEEITQENSDWLKNLKSSHKDDKYMCIHGSITDDKHIYGYIYEMTYENNLNKADEMNLNFAFYGHTHIPYIYYLNKRKKLFFKQAPTNINLLQEDKVFLINPGSVGFPRDNDPRSSFALWDQDNNLTFHKTAYPVSVVTDKMKSTFLPNDLIKRLENGV